MPLVQCPDCSAEVSTQATACPRCGRPMASQPVYLTKPPRSTSPILIGCLALFGICVLFGLIASMFSGSSSSSATTPQDDSGVVDLRNRATSKLLAPSDWSDTTAITRLCEQADGGRLTSAVKSHCAAIHLAAARQRLKERNAVDARRNLNLAAVDGASADDREPIEGPLKKLEVSEAAKKRQIDVAAGKVARLAYGMRLRQRYLDDNLDIKVRVTGRESERITLEFALFNDVWANKMRKGDLLDEMRRLGFKRMDMTDNYDYHVYWDLK
jgi:hypothetical protein